MICNQKLVFFGGQNNNIISWNIKTGIDIFNLLELTTYLLTTY